MQQGRRSVYYFWSCFASGKISQTAEVGRTSIFSSDCLLFSSYKCRAHLQLFCSTGLGWDWGQIAKSGKKNVHTGLLSGNRDPGLTLALLPLYNCWVWDLGSREQDSFEPCFLSAKPPCGGYRGHWAKWALRALRKFVGGWTFRLQHFLGRRAAFCRLGSRENDFSLGVEESVLSLCYACSYLTKLDSLPKAGMLLPWHLLWTEHSWYRTARPQDGSGRVVHI